MPEPVWLQKLGTNNSWQKRYFRLDGRTLSYAKTTTGKAVDKTKFTLDMCAPAFVTGGGLDSVGKGIPKSPKGFPFLFKLQDSSGHDVNLVSGRSSLILAAPTEAERTSWMSACTFASHAPPVSASALALADLLAHGEGGGRRTDAPPCSPAVDPNSPDALVREETFRALLGKSRRASVPGGAAKSAGAGPAASSPAFKPSSLGPHPAPGSSHSQIADFLASVHATIAARMEARRAAWNSNVRPLLTAELEKLEEPARAQAARLDGLNKVLAGDRSSSAADARRGSTAVDEILSDIAALKAEQNVTSEVMDSLKRQLFFPACDGWQAAFGGDGTFLGAKDASLEQVQAGFDLVLDAAGPQNEYPKALLNVPLAAVAIALGKCQVIADKGTSYKRKSFVIAADVSMHMSLVFAPVLTAKPRRGASSSSSSSSSPVYEWRIADGKDAFNFKLVELTRNEGTLLPARLIKWIVNTFVPGLVSKALVEAVPPELGTYLMAPDARGVVLLKASGRVDLHGMSFNVLTRPLKSAGAGSKGSASKVSAKPEDAAHEAALRLLGGQSFTPAAGHVLEKVRRRAGVADRLKKLKVWADISKWTDINVMIKYVRLLRAETTSSDFKAVMRAWQTALDACCSEDGIQPRINLASVFGRAYNVERCPLEVSMTLSQLALEVDVNTAADTARDMAYRVTAFDSSDNQSNSGPSGSGSDSGANPPGGQTPRSKTAASSSSGGHTARAKTALAVSGEAERAAMYVKHARLADLAHRNIKQTHAQGAALLAVLRDLLRSAFLDVGVKMVGGPHCFADVSAAKVQCVTHPRLTMPIDVVDAAPADTALSFFVVEDRGEGGEDWEGGNRSGGKGGGWNFEFGVPEGQVEGELEQQVEPQPQQQLAATTAGNVPALSSEVGGYGERPSNTDPSQQNSTALSPADMLKAGTAHLAPVGGKVVTATGESAGSTPAHYWEEQSSLYRTRGCDTIQSIYDASRMRAFSGHKRVVTGSFGGANVRMCVSDEDALLELLQERKALRLKGEALGSGLDNGLDLLTLDLNKSVSGKTKAYDLAISPVPLSVLHTTVTDTRVMGSPSRIIRWIVHLMHQEHMALMASEAAAGAGADGKQGAGAGAGAAERHPLEPLLASLLQEVLSESMVTVATCEVCLNHHEQTGHLRLKVANDAAKPKPKVVRRTSDIGREFVSITNPMVLFSDVMYALDLFHLVKDIVAVSQQPQVPVNSTNP